LNPALAEGKTHQQLKDNELPLVSVLPSLLVVTIATAAPFHDDRRVSQLAPLLPVQAVLLASREKQSFFGVTRILSDVGMTTV
jgi:hypothetical protein